MKLIKYLQQHGLESLIKHYSIKATYSQKFPELVCLVYDQLNTPKNEITNDCRGIIINKDTFEIVCYPFTRFNDYNPKVTTDFDFDNFDVFEKVDGSLMSLYFYKGEWHVSSKSTPDAHGKIASVDLTYAEYFWQVWKKSKYSLPFLHENLTYIFEFKFPSETQFITKSVNETITFLGTRNIHTHKEQHVLFAAMPNWRLPSIQYITFQEVLNKVLELDPIESEGFVVCDKNFNRMKVKSPAYDYIALLRKETGDFVRDKVVKQENFKRLCQIAKVSDFETFLQYYPDCKNDFKKIKSAKKQLVHELFKLKEKTAKMDGKTLGLFAKGHKLQDCIFPLKQATSVESYVQSMDSRTFIKLIKTYF